MEEQSQFKLILNCKIYKIRFDLDCLSDINENIYSILKKSKEYVVKSSVNDKIFEKYINYCEKKEIPDLCFDNIDQYEKISNEFGMMKNIIDLYKNIHPNKSISKLLNTNFGLKNQLKQKKNQFEYKTINYHQIINHIFNNKGIETKSRYQEVRRELFQSCCQEKVKFVDLLTKKAVKNENGLLFVLNDDEKTAILFRNMSTKRDIFIPRSVKCNSDEFIVKSICEGSFANSNTIQKVEFEKNSEIELIDNFSFSNSSLKNIAIPSSITKIGKGAFFLCNKLCEFHIPDDSKLNVIEKSAFSKSALKSILIPSHLTEIGIKSFYECNYLKNVNFADESELRFIKENAFHRTSLSSLSIPSKVIQIARYSFSYCKKMKEIIFQGPCSIENSAFSYSKLTSLKLSSDVQLKEGFCDGLEKVENISIFSKEINNIQLFEDKFILGKSDSKSEIFDVLLLACKNIKNAVIPSFIKIIGSNSFSNCEVLEKVEFSNDSQLEIIEESAFKNVSIENIVIPPHVKRIFMNSFAYCEMINSIKFSENSELFSIDEFSFSWSSLSSLSIPSSIVEFKEGWCCGTPKLFNVNVFKNNGIENITFFDNKFILKKSDFSSNVFDVLIFAKRSIEEAIIPSFIKKIENYSFDGCSNLQIVHFEENSQLETIEDYAFSSSALRKIFLPKSLKKIEQGCFSYCDHLEEVVFMENSELESIDENPFSLSILESISIPSNISFLSDKWCITTPRLKNINIFLNKNKQNIVYYKNKFLLGKSNQNNDVFDSLLFARRNIKKAKIPSFIKRIENYAFDECKLLKNVTFSDDSKLTHIGQAAFAGSSIECISIPDHVTKIDQYCFCNCKKLSKIFLSNKSELEVIGEKAFILTSLLCFYVPSRVNKIGCLAFSSCDKAKIIEIDENSELFSISRKVFDQSSAEIIMISAKFNELFYIYDDILKEYW